MKTNKILAITFAILSVAAVTTAAFAGPRDHVVNERQGNQADRIHQGVQSGELNHREAARLKQNQREINHYEQRSLKDGNGLSTQEAKRLDHMQDRQSKAIYNQKHDAQERH